MPCFDYDSALLGTEDSKSKALADKKALKDILICILCFVSVFLLLLSSGNHSDIEVIGFNRKEEKENYDILAQFEYEGEVLTINDELTVLPKDYVKEETYEKTEEDYLTSFAKKLIKSINNDTEGTSLILPKQKDGVSIKWLMPKDDIPLWVLVLCMFLCFLIYFSRYDTLKGEIRRKKEEFSEELPNMILQFTLMLNAGLVSEYAFEELIERNSKSDNYLYLVFNALLDKARSTNTSFISEMYSFSCRFGNKEFTRFATLCAEHSHRGSELASKLDAERENSWNSKVSRAKAKAKEAETKLCFPLMLLLVALVILCITPAVIEI